MSDIEDILKKALRARLIPTDAESRKEQRLVSILLATMSVVPPFAKHVLERFGVKMGKTSEFLCYTEVEFPSSDASGSGNGKERPDGVLLLSTRKTRWTALLEAKTDNSEIDQEQIHRYAKIARSYGIDAVITLSNQLTPLPTHVPYSIPKTLKNRVNLFHISWISVLTQAELILGDKEEVDHEQAFILEEMARYFKSPKSGIKRFDQMNKEWRPLIVGINTGQKFNKASAEISNTVSSWHQEERDVCLLLIRRIGEKIHIRLSRKHQTDPALRLRESCDSLIASWELRSVFIVPNAASDIEVTANLERRTISCSMNLNAPEDRKRTSARVNWILRQLRNIDGDEVFLRAFWPGKGKPIQKKLLEAQNNPKCFNDDDRGIAPKSFEVIMVKHLAGRFAGAKTFIEDLEKLVPEFYDRIGQRLQRWSPPAPPIDKRDPIQDTATAEESETNNENGVLPSETGQPRDDLHKLGDSELPLTKEQ